MDFAGIRAAIRMSVTGLVISLYAGFIDPQGRTIGC